MAIQPEEYEQHAPRRFARRLIVSASDAVNDAVRWRQVAAAAMR